MRQLVCVGLVVIVVMMLSVPAFAADSAFVFDVLPSFQTLPLFEGVANTNRAVYDGFLPVGEYDVTLHSSLLGDFSFNQPVVVSYEPVDLVPGSMGCYVETSFQFNDTVLSCVAYVLYDVDEQFTYVVFAVQGPSFQLGEGDYFTFTPVSSDDSSQALSDSLVALFGPYEPQMETVTEVLSDGSSVTYERVIPDVAGLDYEWLASVGLFALVVFCFFRIVGGVAKQ